ncbi:MAG TPA: WecB/TagA/CpsF family glycosyltransferase, partial [Stellaceae bacterium]|nr:WecB/TagA/CpsF family glycosyltransferase [Stellaceae bacterium]
AELARDVRSSHIVGVDGMGIAWAARLLGIAVPERVAGIDLMQGVLALAAEKGYRPYLLGARAAVLDAAVAALKRRHPSLTLAGWRNGYFKAAEEAEIVAGIRAAKADCLFIGLPTPRKERFLAAHREALGVPFVMGVGGSFDVLAGHVRRAPKAVQAAGGEWLFRLAQEPRRLAPRYLRTNLAFAGILAAALLHRAGAASDGGRGRARPAAAERRVRLARSVDTT